MSESVSMEYIGESDEPFTLYDNGRAMEIDPASERVYRMPAQMADNLLFDAPDKWREWTGTPFKAVNIEPD